MDRGLEKLWRILAVRAQDSRDLGFRCSLTVRAPTHN